MTLPPSESDAAPVLVRGELTLIGGLNEKLFRLLRAIAATGSISRAAREIGLSYKGAWEMIDRANNLSPEILVDTAIGGRAGGGTKLTPAGAGLLELFSRLQEEHRGFLDRLNRDLAADPRLRVFQRRFKLQASARNQLFGSVRRIEAGPVAAEVAVALKGGQELLAYITNPSAAALDIAVGREVVALIKAPQVVLVKDFGGFRLSAGNRLEGVVARIQIGAVTADVILKLKGGDILAATLTNESLETLDLAEGESVSAVFPAGAVILGVADA